MQKVKDKGSILKVAREKKLVTAPVTLISQQKLFRPEGSGKKYSK